MEAHHRPEAPQDSELVLRERPETENEEIEGRRTHPDSSGGSSEAQKLPSGQQEYSPEALKSAQSIKDIAGVVSSLQEQFKVTISKALQDLATLRSRAPQFEETIKAHEEKLGMMINNLNGALDEVEKSKGLY